MQVPVLLTRQVLVNFVPPAIFVLSGMVTSATKEALLVQSGALVGRDVPTVGVAVNGVEDVTVAEVSAGNGVNVSVVTGASVMEISAVGTWVSVSVNGDVAVAAGTCPLQADRASVIRAVTMNSFLIILSLLGYHCILSLRGVALQRHDEAISCSTNGLLRWCSQ